MEKITILVVGGESYQLCDPTGLPQPADPAVGAFLQVQTVEDGKVTAVCAVPASDIGSVKSVNGAQPDESGNVTVASTCELAQPRWGSANVTVQTQLLSVMSDGRYGFTKPMSQEEFDTLMARATSAKWVNDEGEHAVDLGDIEYKLYDYNPGEEEVMCFFLPQIDAVNGYEMLTVYGLEEEQSFTKIPAEYLDMGDVAAALDHIIALQEELIA